MIRVKNLANSFFGVLIRSRTYLNILYLLASFPLGVIYCIFLLTGWFLGYGLLMGGWQSIFLATDLYSRIKILPILFSGIGVWLLVLATCWIPAALERQLPVRLLEVDIPVTSRRFSNPRGRWARIWTYLLDPMTWKCFVFVALKFPVGIATFTFVIGLISAAAAMVFAPIAHLIGFNSFIIGPWRIDTWGETFVASALGIFAVPLSLHLLNGFAFISGWSAKVMLGGAIYDSQQKPENQKNTRI